VAPYRKVRELGFVDVIPKSLTGKMLRRELIDSDGRRTRRRRSTTCADITG